MDYKKYLQEKYQNLGCSKCNGLFSVCLDIFCTSQRIFCEKCILNSMQNHDLLFDFNQNESKEKGVKQIIEQNFHKGHPEQVHCMGKLLEMNEDECIVVESHQMEESPMSQKQKDTYIGLMQEVDEYEKVVLNQFKILRSNISEKYNLISSTFDQNISLNISSVQKIISNYQEEYSTAFEIKISNLLKSLINPIKLQYVVLRDNLINIQEHALNSIKSIANQIKIQHKVEINQLLKEKWVSAIHDMTSYKDCFVLCGDAMRMYQPRNTSSNLVKSYDFNIQETIRFVQFSRDGGILAAGGNGKLVLFSTDKMKIIFNQIQSSINVQYYAADISPDNQYFAFSVKNRKSGNNVYIFDIADHNNTPKLKQTISDHSSLILSIKFSNDGQFLFTSGCDYKIIVYQYNSSEEQYKKVQILRDNDDIINDIVVSNDSKILVSVSIDGKCYIYTRKINHPEGYSQLSIENNLEIERLVEKQKQFENLNQVKFNSDKNVEEEQKLNNDNKMLEELHQQLFRKSPSENPFLAQSLLQDKNYLKYQLEKGIQETEQEKAIERSKEENSIFENFDDNFLLNGYFSLVERKSISSADIDSTCNILAICSSEDILIYDISNKSNPRLINCVKNSTVSIINKVKFSHFDNILYFCDQSGQFQSFRYK